MLWDLKGNYTDLGSIGGTYSLAFGINDRNWVVGRSSLGGGQGETPFLWRDGQMSDLGRFYSWGLSSAEAVNNPGQVVGVERDPEGSIAIPWIWDETGGRRRMFSTAGGEVHDINDLGQAVGARGGAFVWQDGKSLGIGGVRARAINNLGEVVGTSGRSESVPTVWIDRFTMYDVNALLAPGTNTRILDVFDINDEGQIVASGYVDGVGGSILLTPVPEPATLLFLGVGLAALARRRRLR